MPWPRAGRGGRRTPKHPCTAYLADTVVKCSVAIDALAEVPAKNFSVKSGGAGNIGCGHLNVANLAIRTCRRHQ